jgi:type IV pilus assembly protein PilA
MERHNKPVAEEASWSAAGAVSPEEAYTGPAGFPVLRIGAMLLGVIGWGAVLGKVGEDGSDAFDDFARLALVPTLVWLAAQFFLAAELPAGRRLDAIAGVIVLPVVWALHAGVFYQAQPALGTVGLWGLAAALAILWLAITVARWRVLHEDQWYQRKGKTFEWRDALLRGVDFTEIFLAVVIASLLVHALPTTEPYTVKSRVSELILAASSAKTVLSEGLQTYGTWSAGWMAPITISATGMVASATIGPTGVITVSGIAATSFSVITLTPTIKPDNKLAWTCKGTPTRYMPASCR